MSFLLHIPGRLSIGHAHDARQVTHGSQGRCTVAQNEALGTVRTTPGHKHPSNRRSRSLARAQSIVPAGAAAPARSAPGLRSTPYRPARAPHLVASPAACGSSIIESLTKARRQRRVVSPLAASSALLGARGSRIQARRLARRSNARDLAQTGWSTLDRKAVHDITLCTLRAARTRAGDGTEAAW